MSDRRIYFDANAFIRAIESQDDVSTQLLGLFASLRSKVATAITSELTLAEVLAKANSPQQRSYQQLIIHSGLFILMSVTRDILLDTVRYRQHFAQPTYDTQRAMPKLPDAIHIVTAVNARCDTIVSFDRGLRLPQNLKRIGLEEDQFVRLVQEYS